MGRVDRLNNIYNEQNNACSLKCKFIIVAMFTILSYHGLRLSNLTLGLTALIFSDWIRHDKPKIVTINMINHKAVQKSINTRPPDKTACLIYIQFSYLTTKMYVQCAQKNCHIKMVI